MNVFCIVCSLLGVVLVGVKEVEFVNE